MSTQYDVTLGVTKGESFEASEDIPSNLSAADTLGDLIAERHGRRSVLKGLLATTAVATIVGASGARAPAEAAAMAPAGFKFDEIEHGVDETHHVAKGYNADVLIRWGDPIVKGAPAFDPKNQTAAAQLKQFGYNGD